MSSFLEKLERWIHILDDQLNDTTVQMITGKVLTHDPAVKVTGHQEEAVPQEAVNTSPAPQFILESHKTETKPYPSVMKKAHASHK